MMLQTESGLTPEANVSVSLLFTELLEDMLHEKRDYVRKAAMKPRRGESSRYCSMKSQDKREAPAQSRTGQNQAGEGLEAQSRRSERGGAGALRLRHRAPQPRHVG